MILFIDSFQNTQGHNATKGKCRTETRIADTKCSTFRFLSIIWMAFLKVVKDKLFALGLLSLQALCAPAQVVLLHHECRGRSAAALTENLRRCHLFIMTITATTFYTQGHKCPPSKQTLLRQLLSKKRTTKCFGINFVKCIKEDRNTL